MKTSDILQRLDEQDWECVYCGKPIEPGQQICRCFDNHGISHLECHSMGPCPAKG